MANNSGELLFVDQPDDLLRSCQTNGSAVFCVFSHILGILSAYVFPFFAVFGLITNIINFLVFVVWIPKQTRQMIYLGALALADIQSVIVFGWFWMFPAKGLPYASKGKVFFFTFNQGEPWCKTHRYFYAFAPCLAVSIFTLTVGDRTFSVYFPFKAVAMGTKKAWQLTAAVVVLSAVLMLPFGTETGYYRDGPYTICWLRYESVLWNVLHLLLANCGLFQTALIIVFNVALVLRLKQARDARKGLQEGSGGAGSLKSKEISASIMLLILSLIFLVCSLAQVVGYTMAFLLQYSNRNANDLLRYAWNISDIGWQLFFFQESINWIVYMTRMPEFKRAVMKYVCCSKVEAAQSSDSNYLPHGNSTAKKTEDEGEKGEGEEKASRESEKKKEKTS